MGGTAPAPSANGRRMRVSRRRVLSLVPPAALGLLLPGCPAKPGSDDTGDTGHTGDTGDTGATGAPARSPEPPPWDAPGAEDPALFPNGLRAGDARADAVVLSVRTSLETFTLVLMQGVGEAWEERDRVLVTAADGGAILVIEGLSADTPFACAVYLDPDTSPARSGVTRFRTAATSARVVQFGATSCLGDHSPEYPCLGFVAADQLDFFCHLGDFVYADGARTTEEYRAFYEATLAVPALRQSLDSTSVVATWDDHELANNWSWEEVDEAWYEAALGVFRETLPQTVGPTGGIWRSLSWGETLELFVLDCRSERRDGRYISEEQMSWLQEGLRASTARFKIILNSVPITDLTAIFGSAQAEDRWDGSPEERSAILGWIAEQGITGVLWVTGDVHFAAVTHVDPPGGPAEAAWEVFVGPAGATPNALVELYEPDAQYLWLSSAWNWARFTCDPVLGTIRVEHIGEDGSVLNDTTLVP